MERTFSSGTLSVTSADGSGIGGLEEHSGLQAYLDPDFDAVQFARSVLERHGAAEGLSLLEKQKSEVESALSTHVSENNEELLGRLAGTDELKVSLTTSKQHANALSASLGRLGRDISDPFGRMKKDASKLRNILHACKTLDRTRRFLRAINRLKVQLVVRNGSGDTVLKLPDSARELAKAAQVLHEIELLLSKGELQGIEVVDREKAFLDSVGSGIRSKTDMVLNRAITEVQYQSEVAPALQAFFNLGILAFRVNDAIDWVVSNIIDETQDALDAHALGDAVEEAANNESSKETSGDVGGSARTLKLGSFNKNKRRTTKTGTRIKPPVGQEKAWKAMLWTRVEALEASIRTWSLRIWNLQRVLNKKRDPVTHVCFADQVYSLQLEINASSSFNGGTGSGRAKKRMHHVRIETVYERYWRLMTQALHGQIEKASKSYPFIRSTLGVQEYPKLRALFRSLPGRIARSANRLAQRAAGQDVVGVSGSNEEVQAILRALQPLLELFLAQSHHRLKETVELMFPQVEKTSALPTKQNALPTRNDVITFAKTLASELAAGKADADLSAVIARGAGNAINLFVSKAEDIVVMDEQAFLFAGIDPSVSDGGARVTGSASTSLSSSSSTSSKAGDRQAIQASRTPAQIHNIAVLSLVLKLESLVLEIPEKTTPAQVERRELVVKSKASALRDASERLKAFAEFVLGDYLSAALRALHKVIALIHQENFRITQEAAMGSELESVASQGIMRAFSLLREQHLDHLPLEYPVVVEMCKLLQARTASLFCRHVSLVRPVSAQGRMRLTNELTQFELALARLSLKPDWKLSHLGDAYAELRALRQLLFVEKPDEVKGPYNGTAGELGDTIIAYKTLLGSTRLSTLWHSIFADAPAELRSPCSVASSGASTAHPELDYVNKIEAVELKAFEENQKEVGSHSESANVLPLRIGLHHIEPPQCVEYVWSMIAASCDKYKQMLSAKEASQPFCVQYSLLQALHDDQL